MSQSIQPPNYLANMPNPQQSFVQGLQLGQGVVGMQQEQQSQEQMRQALGQLAANPTTENIARTMIQFPSLADKLKEPLKSVTETERTGRIESAMPIYAALASGNPDVARERLLEMATAADNSGRTGEARRFRAIADTARTMPGMAMFEIGGVLAANMGPDKFFETFKGVSMLPSDVRAGAAGASQKETEEAARPAQLAAEIAAKRATTAATIAQLQRDAQSNGVTIDSNSMGVLNTSVREATDAASDANRMGDVARRIEDGIKTQGAPAQARAAVERFLGSGEFVKLRTEYNNLRNNALIRQLGPMTGASSDKDVALFMSGFIDENAAPETLASFLRGMEKVARADAATRQSRASWISNFGSLRDATRETSIGGFAVQPGSSFIDFEKNYSQFLLGFNRRGTAQEPSYMRFAPQAGR